MKFEIRTHFDLPPEEYWTKSDSRELSRLIDEASGVERTLLSEERGDGKTTREYRVTQTKDLPPAAQKMMRTQRLSYNQTQAYDDASLSMRWSVNPEIFPGKVKIEGTVEVVPNGTGCERVVRGEINVAIPLVGGKIEKHVVNDLKRSYERAGRVTAEWLKENS